MEKLNLLLNMMIIAYILVKEFGNITKSIKKTSKNIKKDITAVKKQLIIRSIKKEQEEEYDEEFAQRCYAVARGKIFFDKHSFMNDIAEDTVVDCNGLSEEDAESPDFLLATCIAVGEDGHEEVIDFDLREAKEKERFSLSMPRPYIINCEEAWATRKTKFRPKIVPL